jgi:hypothetical protein
MWPYQLVQKTPLRKAAVAIALVTTAIAAANSFVGDVLGLADVYRLLFPDVSRSLKIASASLVDVSQHEVPAEPADSGAYYRREFEVLLPRRELRSIFPELTTTSVPSNDGLPNLQTEEVRELIVLGHICPDHRTVGLIPFRKSGPSSGDAERCARLYDAQAEARRRAEEMAKEVIVNVVQDIGLHLVIEKDSREAIDGCYIDISFGDSSFRSVDEFDIERDDYGEIDRTVRFEIPKEEFNAPQRVRVICGGDPRSPWARVESFNEAK